MHWLAGPTLIMSFGRVLILTNLLVLETGNDVRETTLLILEADLRNPPQLKITGLCFNQDLLVSMYLSKLSFETKMHSVWIADKTRPAVNNVKPNDWYFISD